MSRATKAAAPAKTAAASQGGAGEVRIIGGQWKRTRLAVASNQPGLRPTPARVRETLFNWLGQNLAGWRCIDAFAGTGALGYEAASRGAASVLLCEQNSALVVQMQKMASRLQAASVRVQRCDGVAALRNAAPGQVDLVLLDPPFDSSLLAPALRAAAHAVADGGYIYLEAPTAWTDALLAELLAEPVGARGILAVERTLRAGAVYAHLLHRLPLTASTAVGTLSGAMQPPLSAAPVSP